jgi:hypothetical protein
LFTSDETAVAVSADTGGLAPVCVMSLPLRGFVPQSTDGLGSVSVGSGGVMGWGVLVVPSGLAVAGGLVVLAGVVGPDDLLMTGGFVVAGVVAASGVDGLTATAQGDLALRGLATPGGDDCGTGGVGFDSGGVDLDTGGVDLNIDGVDLETGGATFDTGGATLETGGPDFNASGVLPPGLLPAAAGLLQIGRGLLARGIGLLPIGIAFVANFTSIVAEGRSSFIPGVLVAGILFPVATVPDVLAPGGIAVPDASDVLVPDVPGGLGPDVVVPGAIAVPDVPGAVVSSNLGGCELTASLKTLFSAVEDRTILPCDVCFWAAEEICPFVSSFSGMLEVLGTFLGFLGLIFEHF